jgi:hypothetical protein
VAFDVFSYLYIMHNVSTWVCLAKYTGRVGLHFKPQNYDEMNLGAAELYDEQITQFDVPTVAESLAAVQAWRITMLEQSVTDKARDWVSKLHLALFYKPFEGQLSEVRLRRIKTHWGTVVFADTERGMLRHGREEFSPTNLFVAEHHGIGHLLRVTPDGSRYTIAVVPLDNVLDKSRASQPMVPAETFAITPVAGDGQLKFGLQSSGHFLCAEIDGRVTLSRGALGPWEMFQFFDGTVPRSSADAASVA